MRRSLGPTDRPAGLTLAPPSQRQICSHLRSPSLYRLAKTNKRLYATLQAETGQAMWRRQLETAPAISLWFAGLDVAAMRKLPLEDGHPINPLMIAALYAESTCQVRSSRMVVYRKGIPIADALLPAALRS